MRYKGAITYILLIAFMVLENLCLYCFFKQGILGQGLNAILLFISSVSFGIVLLWRFYKSSVETPALTVLGKKRSYILVLLLLVGLIVLGSSYNAFFIEKRIAHDTSDIIPVIQIMCQRLFIGHDPYAIIGVFGWDQHVSYFPFHWLPFTVAELLHIDYRWITYVVWCIAALWLCLRSMKIPNIAVRAAAPVIIFASNYVLFSCNNGIIEATVELMIAGYYMMLVCALNQSNGILQGFIISLCLLSRYSLVLWLPLYAFTLFVTGHRKQLYTSVATVVIIALLVFVIPFLSKDWSILQGYKYYDDAAMFEWTHINVKTGKPTQLWAGTGYAYFFYTRFTGLTIIARIKLLQRVQLICSLLVIVIMGIWFWCKREHINHKVFLLGSFKIYFAIFLFLIQVPYEYLMCVGNFVTVAIFCEQARYRLLGKA